MLQALQFPSLASTMSESYRVATFDCINDDGTPNPNAAGECTSSIYATVSQIPCTDRAQVNWNEPYGMQGESKHIPLSIVSSTHHRFVEFLGGT